MRWGGYLTASTSTGSAYLWLTDSGQARHLLGSASGRTIDNGTTGWQYIHFPGYGRYDSNSQTYYDDIYVATGEGALARIEIGNAPTLSECKNLAVVTPTSWTDGQITATARLGSFTSGTAYLFVIDKDGVPSAGKEITIGSSSGGDTTAPASPSGLSVN